MTVKKFVSSIVLCSIVAACVIALGMKPKSVPGATDNTLSPVVAENVVAYGMFTTDVWIVNRDAQGLKKGTVIIDSGHEKVVSVYVRPGVLEAAMLKDKKALSLRPASLILNIDKGSSADDSPLSRGDVIEPRITKGTPYIDRFVKTTSGKTVWLEPKPLTRLYERVSYTYVTPGARDGDIDPLPMPPSQDGTVQTRVIICKRHCHNPATLCYTGCDIDSDPSAACYIFACVQCSPYSCCADGWLC